MMNIRFWGTRGSIASPGKSTLKYGGNTPCIEVRVNKHILIFDAGTGIRNLGNQLIREFHSQPVTLHLFISHTHWDHIQGFPFFMPAYAKNFQIMVYGPPARNKSLKELMKIQMDMEYFPVPLGDLNAQIVMQEVHEPFSIEDVKIIPFYVNHPAMTLSYRVTAGARSFIYASDNEPYRYTLHAIREEQGASPSGAGLDQKFIEFLAGADFLASEAQYTLEEYRSKIGWGHSPVESVVELAVRANVKQLALFHHDPTHDDATIDAMVKHAQKLLEIQKSNIRCFGAAEGMEVKLT
ncbi:MAG: MBL fold metallo-hydrolase [Syntrophobacteraceae bacterium CG23_combo_of_CG06-09_8_20_14_all_50_8]|nr:MAG: MBL fold metallo-hydrolase [Syntrophobacteraceae bacterium CG23_combo_of_CG06-09_8_20_14_all_50_8]